MNESDKYNPVPIEANPEHLPVINRIIASAVIFSSDGKVLLGRKDAKGGGVYSETWHLPGGGVEDGEAKAEAAAREVGEEVGLELNEGALEALPGLKSSGATPKTLKDGTRAWCEMEFNYYRYVSDLAAERLAETLVPGSDFVELRFFEREELSELPSVPGGIEERIINGTLTATSMPPENRA